MKSLQYRPYVEQFEDTKGVIRSCLSKNEIQYNGKKYKYYTEN
jgi:hypothetical protein